MGIFKYLFVILFSLTCFSQELYKVSFGKKDGLPTLNIYSSFSAKNGMIWFASDMGVLQYDGYTFKQITTQEGLADDEVFNFFQDKKNRLWFYSYNGKISFLDKGIFYNESHFPFLKIPNNLGFINQITENEDGSFEIIYSKGALYHLDLKKKVFYPKNKSVYFNYKFKQNNTSYYISTNAMLDKNFKKITDLGIPDFNTLTFARYASYNNKTFVTQSNIVYVIENLKCKKLLELEDKSNEIIYLYTDVFDKLWIGTRLGLYIYDLKNIHKKPDYYFPKHGISSINTDFEGKTWITTLDNGILYIPNPNAKILKHNTEDIIASSLGFSNNTLLAGTNLDNYFEYKIPSNTTIAHPLKSFKAKNHINQIISYENKTYIIGKHGIRIISKTSTQDVPFIGTKYLHFDKDSVWIGATYLLKIPIKDLSKLSNIGLISSDSRVVLTEKTNCITNIGNTKWIGTNNGLFLIENGKTIDLSLIYPITKTIISDFCYLKESNLLVVATNNKGLFVFKNKKKLKHITTQNGLLSNTIFRLRQLDNSSVFVCTNQGLNKFNSNTVSVSNLNKYLGFENFKISDIQNTNKQLYLATENGLLYLPSSTLNFYPVKPKINIDVFEVNNKKLFPFENHQLTYKENNIKIGFSGISFQSQKNIKYQYRLKGSDNNWQTTYSRELNYKSIEPGIYQFEIMAINGSDTKSEIITIPFEIAKPFWQTAWFMLLISALVGFTTLWLWKKRVRHLNDKFERERIQLQMERDKINLEKQMAELEHKALRMQMNPHFIFNALNTIKGYYSEGNDEKANDYISKFSMLLRLLLENSEPLIPLVTEIKMLELYIDLTKIRYKNIFDYTIEVTPNIQTEDTAIPPLLLQPMVENAVIHGLAPKGQKGTLKLSFVRENNLLVCQVNDNGIGLQASAEKQKIKHHESKAISITKERISLLGNEIEKSHFEIYEQFDAEKNSLGTSVTITIPFKTIW